MSNDIRDFLGVDLEKKKLSKFKKLKKGKTQKEIRALEEKLLKPEKIPKHVGKTPTATSPIQEKSIRVFFPTRKWVRLFKKHFKCFEYIENSTVEVDMILALLKDLESGRIRYDEKRKKLRFRKS